MPRSSRASPTFAEKKAALAFILDELERQVVFGDGLLQYMRLAFGILEPDELLANLRAAHKTRPDLWHAWSALMLPVVRTRSAPPKPCRSRAKPSSASRCSRACGSISRACIAPAGHSTRKPMPSPAAAR
jgi:hypothetical protein